MVDSIVPYGGYSKVTVRRTGVVPAIYENCNLMTTPYWVCVETETRVVWFPRESVLSVSAERRGNKEDYEVRPATLS